MHAPILFLYNYNNNYTTNHEFHIILLLLYIIIVIIKGDPFIHGLQLVSIWGTQAI